MKPAKDMLSKAKALRMEQIRAEIETLRTEFDRIIRGQTRSAPVGEQQANKSAAFTDAPLSVEEKADPLNSYEHDIKSLYE